MPTDARELLFTRDGVHARQAMNKARNHQTLVNDFAKEGSLRLCGGCKLGKKCLLLPPIRAPVIPPMALPPGLRPLACPTMSLLPVTPPKRLLRARCLLSPTLQWVACSCRDHIWRATLWWLKAHHFCLAALRLRRQKATRARRRCPWLVVLKLRVVASVSTRVHAVEVSLAQAQHRHVGVHWLSHPSSKPIVVAIVWCLRWLREARPCVHLKEWLKAHEQLESV